MGIIKQEFGAKEKEKREEEKQQEQINAQIQRMREEIGLKEGQVVRNKNEKEEKRKTLGQKAERIEELQRKRQELNRYKYALDFKIKELKEEKGPREEEIAKMKQQLHNMQIEIEQFTKQNQDMKLAVKEYNLKLQGLDNQLRKNTRAQREKQIFLENFENHVQDLLNHHLGSYKELKKKLLFLYNNYVLNEEKFVEENVDKKKAFTEQRAYLESCIKTLKEKFLKNLSVHKSDNKRIMKENVDLIRAINELKRDKKLKVDNQKKIEELKLEAAEEIDLCVRIERNKKDIARLQTELEEIKKSKI